MTDSKSFPMVWRVLLATLVLAVGCKQTEGALVVPATQGGALPEAKFIDYEAVLDTVHMDASTPDRALKSWWHYEDVRDSISLRPQAVALEAPHIEKMTHILPKILGGDALAESVQRATPEIFRREIVQVNNESPTRAMVVARLWNVTPVAEGATVGEYERKQRENGSVFHYIFERDSTGWKLVQAQRQEGITDSAWTDYYTPGTKAVPYWVVP